MQVAQLEKEKEKKELSERLRIVAKRVDRIERAYRKDARLLLAQDYEQQRTTDRETFAAIQTQCKEGARLAHKEDLETKKRLARMLPDYEKRRVVVIAKKGEEYAKRKDAARRKIEGEKAKRRKAVMAKREEALPKNPHPPRTSLSSSTRCLVSARLRRRRRRRAFGAAVVGAGRPPRRHLSRLCVRRWRAAHRGVRRAPARCCAHIRSWCAAWWCPRQQQLARQARSGWWCT
jgi:translation initiation factor 3 subunit A